MPLLLMANVAFERHGMTIMIDEGRLWPRVHQSSPFRVKSETAALLTDICNNGYAATGVTVRARAQAKGKRRCEALP